MTEMSRRTPRKALLAQVTKAMRIPALGVSISSNPTVRHKGTSQDNFAPMISDRRQLRPFRMIQYLPRCEMMRKTESIEQVGSLSAYEVLHAARLATIDLLKAVNSLAEMLTKWDERCDRKLYRWMR